MKTITILSVTSLRINEHAVAINRTAEVIPYQTKRLLLCPTRPDVSFSGEWKPIPEWMPRGQWDLRDFNRFLLVGLADYITTDVCITVHWDGYGVHSDRWTDAFLEFDYIGAPWPPWMTSNPIGRVGNGGFSLRSKRWLDVGRELRALYVDQPEDVFSCQTNINHYLEHGCKVAPIDIALQFSIEHGNPEHPIWPTSRSLGFHGWWNPDREKYRIKVSDTDSNKFTMLDL